MLEYMPAETVFPINQIIMKLQLAEASIKEASKDAKIYVRRSTTVQNLLFRAHTLYMITLPKLCYWLVSESVLNNYCAFRTVMAKSLNNNVDQKNFVRFHNYFPLLTMIKLEANTFNLFVRYLSQSQLVLRIAFLVQKDKSIQYFPMPGTKHTKVLGSFLRF